MRPRPDQLLTTTHWLIAAGLAGAAHLAVLIPGHGAVPLEHVSEAGVELDLGVTADASARASEHLAQNERSTPRAAETALAAKTETSTVAARPTTTAVARAAEASKPSSPGRTPDTDYLTELQLWLARFRNYPESAQHKGWEGIVELSFSIDANGRIRRARMVRSSGFVILDNAAFELLDRASPLPRPPADDLPLSVTVPVAYQLSLR